MARPRRPNPDAPAWWTTDEWITPPEIVAECAAKYGPFDLDPAARAENCQAAFYYDLTTNGLVQPWFGKVWLNMPYSKPGPWYEKAYREVHEGRAEIVVTLGPPAVDTEWYHQWVKPYAEVEFLRGRIAFIGYLGTPILSPRSGNMVAVYRRPRT